MILTDLFFMALYVNRLHYYAFYQAFPLHNVIK